MASYRNVSRVASSAFQSKNRALYTKRNFSAALLSPSFEFPDLPFQSGSPAKASETSITTLPSGLHVVTEDASFSTTVTLTFPSAGSHGEQFSEGGAALANKNLSLKSGSGLSSLLILRNIENAGATPCTFASRYNAGVGFVAAPDQVDRIIPLLATKCSYEKWDLREAIGLAGDIIDAEMKSVQTVLSDQIYAAAYGAQTTSGRSFFTKAKSPEALVSFRERTYVANGAVLAATGIKDHDAFVKVVQDGFSDMPSGAEFAKSSLAYVGGESRVPAAMGGFAHMALAFEIESNNTPLANVMKSCLSILSPENIKAFCAPGLIGLYTSSASADAPAAVDALCSTFLASLTNDVIARGKSLAKAEAIFAMDGGSMAVANAMTGSVLETGSFSVGGTAATYDAISSDMVVAAFKTALSKKPSLASVGETESVPYFQTVASKFA